MNRTGQILRHFNYKLKNKHNMESLQTKGTIVEIFNTVLINDKFQKREFVIETGEEFNGKSYHQYIKFQTTQKKTEILSSFAVGELVTVSFNLRGNRYEKDGKVGYITNLECWKVESEGKQATAAPTPAKEGTGTIYAGGSDLSGAPDDLPF